MLAAALAWMAVSPGCAFRDEVPVGSDEPAAQGGGQTLIGGGPGRGMGAGAGGETSGAGGRGFPNPHGGDGGSLMLPPSGPTACDVGNQNLTQLVSPGDSLDAMGEGSGGPLRPGTYRLVALVEHGSCGCFDADAPLMQTLVLDQQTGYVISDTYDSHWAATFRYGTRANAIWFEPTCAELGDKTPASGPFGPFATFTATEDSLWLISPACHYRAGYQRLPTPPAR